MAKQRHVDTTQLEELRRGAREFCDRVLRPGVRDRDHRAEFPAALVNELASVGYLALTFPEKYGGLDLTAHEYVAVTEELGAADGTARGLVSVTVGLVGGSLLGHGRPEQQDRWLPEIARGGLGSFALTEPGAGSNPSEMSTTATLVGDSWVVRGSKMWITNGTTSVVILLFARAVVDGEDRGITCFVVPRDTAGLSAAALHGKLGLRAQDTAELSFEDMRLPVDSVLGEVGHGLRVALSALDSGRLSVAAGAVGLAREALDVSVEYAKQREQFGRPIAGFQLVQMHLSDSHVDVEASRALVERAAALKGDQRAFGLAASVAKLFATEAAIRCADRAIQVHGGYGYVDEYPAERLLRDARVLTLYEGTSEVQRLLIGKQLTGISAFT